MVHNFDPLTNDTNIWPQPQPLPQPNVWPQPQPLPQPNMWPQPQPALTAEEIKELRKLLERARDCDKRNNQTDCELEKRRQLLRDLAKELGVEIAFL